MHILCLCANISARVASIVRGRNDEDEADAPRPPLVTLKRLRTSLTHEADRAPENPFPLDPEKLTTTLIANLGLGHMLAPKGSRRLAQLHSKIDTLPLVEKIILSLEPLSTVPGSQGKSNRLFRITKGDKKGHILGLHERHKGENDPSIPGDRISIYTIYSAERHVNHVRDNYVIERNLLATIGTDIDNLYHLLGEAWEEMRTPKALRGHIDTLTVYVNQLRFVKDADKQKLFGVIRMARTCLQKKNPGATRAALMRQMANDFIGKRLGAMNNIIGELSHDQSMLQSRIAQEAAVVEVLHRKVLAQQEQPRLADPGKSLSASQIIDLCRNINLIGAACAQHVVFEPNRTFADKLEESLQKTVEALEKKYPEGPDRESAAAMFMRAFVVSKLARFNHFLMRFYDKFSVADADDINVEKRENDLAIAAESMNTRGAARTVYTPEFNALWAEIRALIEALNAAIASLNVADTPAARTAAAEKIKACIGDFALPGKVAVIQLGATPHEKGTPNEKPVDMPATQA